jgi:periplasmic protein TonB
MKCGLVCILAVAGFAFTMALSQETSQDAQNTDSSQVQKVRVSQGVASGLLIKKVQPKYPKKARKNYIQGTVVLHAEINKEGSIANLVLISGDPLLAEAAMDAVKQWQYKPYLLKGQPVSVETEILVNFQLTPR